MSSNITAPRVPLTDQRTGLMTREWYNFFLTLFNLTGAGQNVMSITDLQLGPPVQEVVVTVNPEPSDGYLLAQLTETLKTVQGLQEAPLVTALAAQLAETLKALQGLQEGPSVGGLLEQVTELAKALQGVQVAPPVVVSPGPALVGTVTANLDFPNTVGPFSSDLTITVPGAVEGDFVTLALPSGSILPDSCYTGWVSGPDTVTVRFNNYSAAPQDPPAGNFRAMVTRL